LFWCHYSSSAACRIGNDIPCGDTEAKEVVDKMKDKENKHIICLASDVMMFLHQCGGRTAF